jgi:hypothetical protein
MEDYRPAPQYSRASIYIHQLLNILGFILQFLDSTPTKTPQIANMGIKIHGAPGSTCTRRVLTVLHAKNVPFELVPINFYTNEQKSEAFMKMQPFGKVPVLEDDGVFIYESRAIAKYIAKKYAGQGPKLIPADDDLVGYGLFEQVGVT